jgi:amino acid transporter
MLGYSRIPYAAAEDGNYFKIFARVHPKKHFPHISLLILAGVSLSFSLLFKLKEVITAIIVMRILIQFVSQAVGVIMLRKKNEELPFKMWLYPLPAVIAIIVWLFIFISSGWIYILYAFGVIATGILLFLIFSSRKKAWPFNTN